MKVINLPEVGDMILTEKCYTDIVAIYQSTEIFNNITQGILVVPHIGKDRLLSELIWNEETGTWEVVC